MGGTYVYKKVLPGTSKVDSTNTNPTQDSVVDYTEIDNFALEDSRTWSFTSTPADLTGVTSTTPIEITATTTNNAVSPNKTWTCKIQGTISSLSDVFNSSLGINSQLEELKKAIGIKSDNTRDANIKHNFKKFINKCKENRNTNASTANLSESIIKTVPVEKNETSYKFKDTEFKKLYDGKNEILEKLGIEEKDLNNEHSLDKGKIEKIKFNGKESLTIADETTLKLKIEKTDDTRIFPEGLKFTFKTEKDINSIGIKGDTNPEFKIKINDDTYSLESAWDISTFSAKVGLNCANSDGNNSCTFGSKINVYKDDSSNVKDASVENGGNSKTITFAKGEKGYNQGFKFKVSENINLTNSSGSTPTQLTSEGKSYEIGIKNIGGTNSWFLIEKDEKK